MQLLFTLGYEGLSTDDFIQLLQANNIEHVIDVRRNPISRKSGFSKTALLNILALNKINYTHLVDLGTPKEIRSALKIDKNYECFFDKIKAYLESQEEVLNVALDIALSQICVLLCFEREPLECHRSAVAAEIVRRSNLELTVEHIEL